MARALALGFLVGFPIAAAPGPMFFLVVRRTLARGRRSGLVSGFGVATGDAAYAALAAFGVAAVTNVLVGERRWIGLAGGIALALIGLRTIFGPDTPHPDPAHAGNPATLTTLAPPQRGRGKAAGDYASMVALTLSNPPTILSFTAVFAGFGLRVGSGWQPGVGLVLGVMIGSTLWWVLVALVVSVVRERLTATMTRGIGVISGLVLVTFGAFAGASALMP